MVSFFRSSALIALCASTLSVTAAAAEDSLVAISAPTDGEKLEAGKTYKVDYAVKEGTKAHHVHLFVDGEEIATAHKLKGSFSLGPLTAGAKKVCVTPVNKGHTPIGAQACVSVTVQ